MEPTRPRWPFSTKLIVVLLLLALVVYLLFRFSIIITPFILSVILAYTLSPVANFFKRRLHLHRVLAILLSYVCLLGIAITVPVVLTPVLVSQLSGLNVDIQRILLQVELFLGKRYEIGGLTFDIEALFQQIILAVQGLLEPVFGQTLDLVVGVVSSVVWVIFIIIVSFYLIKDHEVLRTWMENLVPPAYRDDFTRIRDDISQIWSAFFRGQLTLGLVVACIFTALGLILGLPFAIGMGVLAGILEFLPSIGHGIWMTIAALLALFLGSTWIPIPNWIFMLIIIGLHLIFQQFDLNYLIPRIIGSRVHLAPLVVILGIVTGALLAGVLGIPLAAPTIASARVLGRYIYANLVDIDPFPAEPTLSSLPPPNLRWWQPAKKEHNI
jgi:predicted PurR-regulated permease PerM